MRVAVTVTARELPTLRIELDADSVESVTSEQIDEAILRLVDADDITEAVFAQFLEDEGWDEDEREEVTDDTQV